MDSLISARALAETLARGSAQQPALLDVRWELRRGPVGEDYLAGHIPGAVFVDLDAELAAPPGSAGRHPLPSAETFGAAMRAAGVRSGRGVVVYDGRTAMAAARAWWLLRYFGHDDVAVLDGGLAAWMEAGGALQTEIPRPQPGDFTPRPGAMPVLDAAAAADLARRGVLIDARASERFRGESEPVDPVAGHVPGAVNRPAAENLDDRGRFRNRHELQTELEQLGVRDGLELGAYCGSGVVAAHEVLALELAGYRAALYPGSWSEWITDPARPVATGSA